MTVKPPVPMVSDCRFKLVGKVLATVASPKSLCPAMTWMAYAPEPVLLRGAWGCPGMYETPCFPHACLVH